GTVPDLIDSKNLSNLTSKTPWNKATYFNQYQQSFTKGEYNTKETVYTPTGQVIRSYMSGGIGFGDPGTGSSAIITAIEANKISGSSVKNITKVLGDKFQSVVVGGLRETTIRSEASEPVTSSPVTPILLQSEDEIEAFVRKNPIQTKHVVTNRIREAANKLTFSFQGKDIPVILVRRINAEALPKNGKLIPNREPGRETIHFSVNNYVNTLSMGGDWTGMNYVIVVPAGDVLANTENNLLSANETDTFFLGDVTLPDTARIFYVENNDLTSIEDYLKALTGLNNLPDYKFWGWENNPHMQIAYKEALRKKGINCFNPHSDHWTKTLETLQNEGDKEALLSLRVAYKNDPSVLSEIDWLMKKRGNKTHLDLATMPSPSVDKELETIAFAGREVLITGYPDHYKLEFGNKYGRMESVDTLDKSLEELKRQFKRCIFIAINERPDLKACLEEKDKGYVELFVKKERIREHIFNELILLLRSFDAASSRKEYLSLIDSFADALSHFDFNLAYQEKEKIKARLFSQGVPLENEVIAEMDEFIKAYGEGSKEAEAHSGIIFAGRNSASSAAAPSLGDTFKHVSEPSLTKQNASSAIAPVKGTSASSAVGNYVNSSSPILSATDDPSIGPLLKDLYAGLLPRESARIELIVRGRNNTDYLLTILRDLERMFPEEYFPDHGLTVYSAITNILLQLADPPLRDGIIRIAVHSLLRLADDPNPDIRVKVVQTLAQMKDPAAFPVLIDLSGDENKSVREEVARAAVQIGWVRSPYSIKGLRQALRENAMRDRSVREYSEKNGFFAGNNILKNIVPQPAVLILLNLLRDDDPGVHQAALEGLIKYGGVDYVISLLIDRLNQKLGFQERTVIVKDLTNFGKPAVKPLIDALLKGVSSPIKEDAAEILVSIGEAAVPELISALENRDSGYENIGNVLIRIGNPALELLRDRLKDQKSPVRKDIIKIITKIDYRFSTPILVEILIRDKDYSVRSAAFRELTLPVLFRDQQTINAVLRALALENRESGVTRKPEAVRRDLEKVLQKLGYYNAKMPQPVEAITDQEITGPYNDGPEFNVPEFDESDNIQPINYNRVPTSQLFLTPRINLIKHLNKEKTSGLVSIFRIIAAGLIFGIITAGFPGLLDMEIKKFIEIPPPEFAQPPPQRGDVYIDVKPRDTLGHIAIKYYGNAKLAGQLARINRLRSMHRIKAGQQLRLPLEIRHVVRKGDTLWGIGRRYRISTGKIRALNAVVNDEGRFNLFSKIPDIRPGDKIIIGERNFASSAVNETKGRVVDSLLLESGFKAVVDNKQAHVRGITPDPRSIKNYCLSLQIRTPGGKRVVPRVLRVYLPMIRLDVEATIAQKKITFSEKNEQLLPSETLSILRNAQQENMLQLVEMRTEDEYNAVAGELGLNKEQFFEVMTQSSKIIFVSDWVGPNVKEFISVHQHSENLLREMGAFLGITLATLHNQEIIAGDTHLGQFVVRVENDKVSEVLRVDLNNVYSLNEVSEDNIETEYFELYRSLGKYSDIALRSFEKAYRATYSGSFASSAVKKKLAATGLLSLVAFVAALGIMPMNATALEGIKKTVGEVVGQQDFDNNEQEDIVYSDRLLGFVQRYAPGRVTKERLQQSIRISNEHAGLVEESIKYLADKLPEEPFLRNENNHFQVLFMKGIGMGDGTAFLQTKTTYNSGKTSFTTIIVVGWEWFSRLQGGRKERAMALAQHIAYMVIYSGSPDSKPRLEVEYQAHNLSLELLKSTNNSNLDIVSQKAVVDALDILIKSKEEVCRRLGIAEDDFKDVTCSNTVLIHQGNTIVLVVATLGDGKGKEKKISVNVVEGMISGTKKPQEEESVFPGPQVNPPAVEERIIELPLDSSLTPHAKSTVASSAIKQSANSSVAEGTESATITNILSGNHKMINFNRVIKRILLWAMLVIAPAILQGDGSVKPVADILKHFLDSKEFRLIIKENMESSIYYRDMMARSLKYDPAFRYRYFKEGRLEELKTSLSGYPLQASEVLSSFMQAEDILNVNLRESEFYRLLKYGSKPVFFFVFNKSTFQGLAFDRLSFFVEQKNGLLSDSRLDQELAETGCEGALGHDFKLEDMANFFTLAAQQGMSLNVIEERMKEELIKLGLLVRTGHTYIGAPDIAIVTYYQGAGKATVEHELNHAEYFINPDYRLELKKLWLSLSEANREFIKTFFSLYYDTGNEDLLIREFAAWFRDKEDTLVNYLEPLGGQVAISQKGDELYCLRPYYDAQGALTKECRRMINILNNQVLSVEPKIIELPLDSSLAPKDIDTVASSAVEDVSSCVRVSLMPHLNDLNGHYREAASKNLEIFLEKLKIPKGSVILNIGSGRNPLITKGWRVINVDANASLPAVEGCEIFKKDFFEDDFQDSLKERFGLQKGPVVVVFYNMWQFMNLYAPVNLGIGNENWNVWQYIAQAQEILGDNGYILFVDFMLPDIGARIEKRVPYVDELIADIYKNRKKEVERIIFENEKDNSPAAIAFKPKLSNVSSSAVGGSIREDYNKEIFTFTKISFNDLPEETQQILSLTGISERLVEFCGANKKIASPLFRIALPRLTKEVGMAFVTKHWDSLVEIAQSSGENAILLFANSLPVFYKAYGEHFMETNWNVLVELFKSSGEEAWVLCELGLVIFKELIVVKDDAEKTTKNLQRIGNGLVSLLMASGRESNNLFIDSLQVFVKEFGMEFFDRYFETLVEAGVLAKENAVDLFETAFPVLKDEIVVVGNSVQTKANLLRISNVFFGAERIGKENAQAELENLALILFNKLVDKLGRPDEAVGRDQIIAIGRIFKNALKLSGKKIKFVAYEFASLRAARGFIEALGLDSGTAEFSFLGDIQEKEVVEKEFPGYRAEKLVAPNKVQDDGRYIWIEFHDHRGVDKEVGASVSLPYFPFKHSMQEFVASEEAARIKKELNVGKRKIIVVGSPYYHEANAVAKAFDELYGNLPRQDRPLLIFAPREKWPGGLPETVASKIVEIRGTTTEKFVDMSEKDVLILYTTGELLKMFAIADLCIVGEDRNIFEPAGLVKPILYFPGDWLFNLSAKDFISRRKGALKFSLQNFKKLMADPAAAGARAFNTYIGFKNKYNQQAADTSAVLLLSQILNATRGNIKTERDNVNAGAGATASSAVEKYPPVININRDYSLSAGQEDVRLNVDKKQVKDLLLLLRMHLGDYILQNTTLSSDNVKELRDELNEIFGQPRYEINISGSNEDAWNAVNRFITIISKYAKEVRGEEIISQSDYGLITDEINLIREKSAKILGVNLTLQSPPKVVSLVDARKKKEAENIAMVNTEYPVSSSADKKGGIDMRVLPIVTQPGMLSPVTSHQSPVSRGGLNLLYSTDGSLAKEWQAIERMFNGGITPSAQRIKEYLSNCCAVNNFDQEIDKVISLMADILRKQEEECCATDTGLKQFLVALESEKTGEEFQSSLAGINFVSK
ncbi:MAG: HEAT repeat domain-containing protein, partial [Candidatus Omnitrophica bacterium]|nr:HEAT repeat domain-containing protein [Candidatus Omnitrophota bacterium]